FFEMRHEPMAVNRITRKASPDMVVNPAEAHSAQSVKNGSCNAVVSSAHSGPPQQVGHGGVWKLGRRADASVNRIDQCLELASGLGNDLRWQSAGQRCRSYKTLQQGHSVNVYAVSVAAVDVVNCHQYVDKARPTPTRLLREVGAAPERFAGWSEEHCQRPAALLPKCMKSRHIDLVDVRSFLPVDFDVDEMLVHDCSDGRILEALVGHDVAPVAGGIANGEQDRFV